MTRLQSEWQRLYGLTAAVACATAEPLPRLIDAQSQVRAMVLTLAQPAEWAALSAVWQGVQADLALPAPAIAVDGSQGYQLWFSLAEPVSALQAHAFVAALQARYLGHIAPARIGLWPGVDGGGDALASSTAATPAWPAALPGQAVQAEQWSAFLAPDLAPMFADTPWLDIPPSPDGQADLLAGLRCIQHAAWQSAWGQLQPAPEEAATAPSSMVLAGGPASAWQPACVPQARAGSQQSPRHFLTEVMNDPGVPLALRVEAAKALLPYSQAPD
jgi:hypothetical protein